MYLIIDQLDGNAVIDRYPTARKALNAARRIEPSPEGPRLGYRSITGHTRDWRYLVQRGAHPCRPAIVQPFEHPRASIRTPHGDAR